MKLVALFATALLLQSAAADAPPIAQPKYLRYMRALSVPAGTGQACAALDAQVFPNAAPSLIDLRIFPVARNAPTAGGAAHEIPYAVTLSESMMAETASARVLNAGIGPNHSIVFDLAMPDRPYTDVHLDLDPSLRDFLATAEVTASDADPAAHVKGSHSVVFGSYTLFDLTSQHLARSTTLPLPESTFPYLHVALTFANAPGSHEALTRFIPAAVIGAEAPPSREAQAVYTTVAETKDITVSGRESIAKFEVPARVPIERIEFVLPAGYKKNFSRDVRIRATAHAAEKNAAPAAAQDPEASPALEADDRAPMPEALSGTILRVHGTQAGLDIDTDQLSIPAVLGANLQRAASVEVAVENGDDQPLPIASIRLEMRERRLCFDAAASAGPLALYYGDAALSAPVYDYDRLFAPVAKPLAVTLGPQLPNPQFTPRAAAHRSFTEEHPQVLWIALIAVIAALGFVALKSGKSVGTSSS